MAETFAQYLLNKKLPEDLKVHEPATGAVIKKLLTAAAKKYPGKYDEIVMHVKNLGDKLSTWEGITFGLAEIAVPNKAKRDTYIAKAKQDLDKARTYDAKIKVLEEVQDKLFANDTADQTDDATLIIKAKAANKANQLMKLRTTPAVVKDYKQRLVPRIIDRSYSEGVSPVDNWLQCGEARFNLAQGQLKTSEPGAYGKLVSSVLNSVVVSMDDCRVEDGIVLPTRSESVLHRYLARPAGKFARNTLMTSEIQQALLKAGTKEVWVRSPETCAAPGTTVCAMCDGLDASGKAPTVGTNVGEISANNLAESSTQAALSAKHSVSMAKTGPVGLSGMTGISQFTEAPKIYKGRQVLCELQGVVRKVSRAPQGGQFIQIRETKKVPDRFKVHAKKIKPGIYQYYAPPSRAVLKEIKTGTEVYPAMALTDGNPSVTDVARLEGLGGARTFFTQGLADVYKNSNLNIDRRHFERLSKATNNYVKIEKAPGTAGVFRGEVVDYNRLKKITGKMESKEQPVEDCEGLTTLLPYGSITAGTYITQPVVDQLKRQGFKKIKASSRLETSAVYAPLSRSALLNTDEWLSNLNHRYIKKGLMDAASTGGRQNLHSYNPIAGYAYGAEFGQGKDGRY